MVMLNHNDRIREAVRVGMSKYHKELSKPRGYGYLLHYLRIFDKHIKSNGDDVFSAMAYAMGELASDEKAEQVFKEIFGISFNDFFFEWDIKEQYDDNGKAIHL